MGFVLLAAALRLFIQPTESDGEPTQPPVGVAIACGGAIGLLAGLTATGGGIFLTPLMILLGWAKSKNASGMSAGFILMNSLAGLAAKPASLEHLRDVLERLHGQPHHGLESLIQSEQAVGRAREVTPRQDRDIVLS